VSLIRVRDSRKRGGPQPAWMTQTERDRRALLRAGDALAAAAAKHINDPRSTPPWHAELHRALLDWKDVTG